MPNPPDVIWTSDYRTGRWLDDPSSVGKSDVKYLRATPLLDNAAALRDALKAMVGEFEETARNSYCNSDEEPLSDSDVEEADPNGYAAWIKARAILKACEESSVESVSRFSCGTCGKKFATTEVAGHHEEECGS